MQYRGAVAGSNTPEATDRLTVLKDEIQRLEDFEKVVDKHKAVRTSCDCIYKYLLHYTIYYLAVTY